MVRHNDRLRLIRIGVIAVAMLAAGAYAHAAETISLILRANGVTIQGEHSQQSLGRANTIEVDYLEEAISRATGNSKRCGPITIRKRIDKSSPMLLRAMDNNEVIEATFRFFRPNPTGDGTTEQYYTIMGSNGRIVSIKVINPDPNDRVNGNRAGYEEISFTFNRINWIYVNGGIEHEVSCP